MSEIKSVYLSSKTPLTPEQAQECMKDIYEKAKIGFLIEIQKEVMAHTSEETFLFTVQKIEPKNKFYGMVDGDTIFTIMNEDIMPPAPQSDPDVGKEDMQLPEELFPDLLSEVKRLKSFIDELETLRYKYDVSWDCLHDLVWAIDKFNKETAPRL